MHILNTHISICIYIHLVAHRWGVARPLSGARFRSTGTYLFNYLSIYLIRIHM